MTAKQDAMYVAREKIYPREVSGVFQSLRKLSALVLLGLYFAVPWLAWGDRPAVLFDLPARKFYVLGMVFWPQDFIFLALLLIISALALFFVTALAGRIWCGYSCPQTVWTEIFLWIEHGIEGNRNRRQKLDRQPWSLNKLGRKTAKHLLWILFSFWTGLTFVGYFSPIHELATSLLEFNANGWEVFWVFFFTAATYGNAGYLREQVCIYMCPYARFQSAMFDRNTLIIAYDGERGEPRGRRPKSVNPATRGLGDCIDCTLCVQVCPTGIDIRNGLQYECIACAACIDACDEVMDKMQYPRGLIRYATENTMEHKPSRIVRPRTILYAFLLLALAGGLFLGLVARPTMALDVIRDRNALYRIADNGEIENVYTFKLMNKSETDDVYELAAAGVDGIHFHREPLFAEVRAGEVWTLPVRLRAPRNSASGGQTIRIMMFRRGEPPEAGIIEEARFFMPGRDND